MAIDNFIERHWKKLLVAAGVVVVALAVGYKTLVSTEEPKVVPVSAQPLEGIKYHYLNVRTSDGELYTLRCEPPNDVPGSCTEYRRPVEGYE